MSRRNPWASYDDWLVRPYEEECEREDATCPDCKGRGTIRFAGHTRECIPCAGYGHHDPDLPENEP